MRRQKNLARISSFLAAAALLAAIPEQTRGQDVLTGLGAWSPSAAPPAVADGITSSGMTALLGSGSLFFDGTGEAQLGAQGKAISSGGGPVPDEFAVVISREQTFTLGEAAQVVTPTFLNGTITFFSPAPGSLAFGTVQGSVQIYTNPGGVLQGGVAAGTSGFAPGGDITVVDTDPAYLKYTEFALAAGAYKVRATLRVAGLSNNVTIPPTPPGDSVTVDFITHLADGLATSLGTYKAGLGSSRDAVRAVAARAAYSVDGTGIAVGLVETGNPYTTHDSLAGKVTVLAGGNPGDYRREHALATAGIIAADVADPASAGIAPKSTIVSAPILSYPNGVVTDFEGAVGAILAANPGLRVMSMSAAVGGSHNFVNQTVNSNPNLLFVKSAGNAGTAGSISEPGLAENVITVGALNRTFAERADFSSYQAVGGVPQKPDIVAPGEYIVAPQSRDVDGDGSVDDFGRVFLGDDFRYTIAQSVGGAAVTGSVIGTSFSAPHVSGAAALLHQFQQKPANVANHEPDHRVMKAVLLNSADRTVMHHGGGAWSQTLGTGVIPGPTVLRSLDDELGAGKLDVLAALDQYAPAEINLSDSNAAANFNIAASQQVFWDLENDPAGGMVNYLLGAVEGNHLRATLTWDFDQLGGTGLMPLEMRLYREGNGINPAGFDIADVLYAETSRVGENVKLFDFVVPPAGAGNNTNFFLQIVNSGVEDALYGLAVTIPEPSAGLLAVIGGCLLLARCRRR